jgi:hypothetical protein
MFLNHFNALVLKIIFLKIKKYYFLSEKQPQPHSQTPLKSFYQYKIFLV